MNLYHESRPKMAFLLENVSAGQLVFNIMMKSMEQNEWDVIIGFEQLSRPAHNHLTPFMHSSELYNYDGPIIATNLKTAEKLIQFPSPCPKFFFCDDLEWIRYPNKRYQQFAHIYQNPELILLARCKDHARLIESCWNVKIDRIIEKYNFFDKDFRQYLNAKLPKDEDIKATYKTIRELI